MYVLCLCRPLPKRCAAVQTTLLNGLRDALGILVFCIAILWTWGVLAFKTYGTAIWGFSTSGYVRHTLLWYNE